MMQHDNAASSIKLNMLTRLRTNSRQPPAPLTPVSCAAPSHSFARSARVVVAGRRTGGNGSYSSSSFDANRFTGSASGIAAAEEEEDSDDVRAQGGEEGLSELSEGETSGEEVEEEVKRRRQPLLKKAECIRLGLCHVCRC